MKRKALTLIILLQAALLAASAIVACGASVPFAYATEEVQNVVSQEAPQTLADLQAASDEQLNEWANLPQFDGRLYDYVTPARNQGAKNICWAYAAVGAVEAGILREGIDNSVTKDNLNLDEIETAYVRFNRDGTHDPLFLTNSDTFSDKWNQGSHADEAFLAMTQGYSPISQTTTDYSTDQYIQSVIKQSKYFIEGFTLVDNDREAIKRAVLQYGSVTMEYKSPSNWQKYLYYSDGSSMGHASLIVGWDDNVTVDKFSPDTPSHKGAWIVKNSWGNHGYNVNGTYCFYLSYDSYLGSRLYSVDVGMRENYPNLYYYDGQLASDGTNYVTDAHGVIYEAKLSSADKQERLKAVVLGVRNEDLTADIKIYRHLKVNPGNVNDAANCPDEGDLAAEKQVFFKKEGVYTVNLDVPVPLTQGEYFSIVISGTDKNGNPLFPMYGVDSAESVNDMTYRKYMGVWSSCKRGDYPDSSYGNQCVRLRAVTDVVSRGETFGNDLQYARVEVSSRFTYYVKGQRQFPDVSVYFGVLKLKDGQDYAVEFSDNLFPGQASIKIVGLNNYYGERNTVFEIAKPLSPPCAMSGTVTVYDNVTRLHDIPIPVGWEWTDNDFTLKQGLSDFSYGLRYIGDDAWCYRSTRCSFKVNKVDGPPPAAKDLTDATVQVLGTYTYTGGQIVPLISVVCDGLQLSEGVDYSVVLSDNVNVGTAHGTVVGKNSYTGEKDFEFTIEQANYPVPCPESVITVGRKTAYLRDIPLNVPNWRWKDADAGIFDGMTAVAEYFGQDKDNFAVTELAIKIVLAGKTDVSSLSPQLSQYNYVYDGEYKTPDAVIADGGTLLVKGVDYDVTYQDNLNAGSAKAIIYGINDYEGSVTVTFAIERAERTNFAVTQEGWTFGDDNVPSPQVSGLAEQAEVTFAYSATANGVFTADKPVNAGNYFVKAVVAFSQNYKSAEDTSTFAILPKDVSGFAMSVADSGICYTGTEICPEVSLSDNGKKLTPSVDFTLIYGDNINAGTAKVTALGHGNYTGKVSCNFHIAKAHEINVDTNLHYSGKFAKLSDVALPDNFVWDETTLTQLSDGKYSAEALYTGGNYDIDRLQFTITAEYAEPPEPAKGNNVGTYVALTIAACVAVAAVTAAFVFLRRRKNR